MKVFGSNCISDVLDNIIHHTKSNIGLNDNFSDEMKLK